MKEGTVKFFNESKGYGFIRPDDGAGDIFLHISAVEEAGLGMLEPGQEIRFNIETNSEKGNNKSAIDLELI